MESDKLNILHISDLHLGPHETIPGLNPSNYLSEFLSEIIERRLSIHCCLISGDLAHGAKTEAYQRLYGLLNSCPWPTRVLTGNHDDKEKARAILGSNYIPDQDVWSWKITKGITIIGVNTTVPGYQHGELSDEQLLKIEEHAKNAKKCGMWLLALHHPPVDVGHWWMDAEGLLKGRQEIVELASKYGSSGILCGHVHMNAVAHESNRVPVIFAPSLVHEVVYDDQRERPLRFRRRSARGLIHQIDKKSLVTVELTTGGLSYLVEGLPWGEEKERSNKRLPAKIGTFK